METQITVKKNCFRPFRSQFGLKIRGPGPRAPQPPPLGLPLASDYTKLLQTVQKPVFAFIPTPRPAQGNLCVESYLRGGSQYS